MVSYTSDIMTNVKEICEEHELLAINDSTELRLLILYHTPYFFIVLAFRQPL